MKEKGLLRNTQEHFQFFYRSEENFFFMFFNCLMVNTLLESLFDVCRNSLEVFFLIFHMQKWKEKLTLRSRAEEWA